MSRRVSTLLALLLAVGAALASDQLRQSAHAARQSAQRYEALYVLPPAEALRWVSLGHDEALADLIWMRALVYFGEELEHGQNVDHVFAYAEAMVALDPRFLAVYRWVGTAGLYRPVAVTPDDIERSVAFMERGYRLYPEDGDLAWDIGAALVYELAPLLDEDPARADAVRERGAPYLMTAVRRGAAPEWASLANAASLVRIGRTEQAARHLEEMYATTRDPATREQIAVRIRELRQRTQAEAFFEATQALEAQRTRDFPYVPAGLYLMLGDRPPVDLDAPIREGLPRALTAPGSPGDATPPPP